jgi:hypothetical protein
VLASRANLPLTFDGTPLIIIGHFYSRRSMAMSFTPTASLSRFIVPFVLATLVVAFIPSARAADHADGPNMSQDQGADLADIYAFLDPNDNSQLVVIMTVHGFITPGEANNFAFFDPNILYRIQFDTKGKVDPDKFIDVTFTQRVSTTDPQIATVEIAGGKKFRAKTTISTLAAAPNPQIINQPENNPGVKFFAGEVDDPFFFDIPAFSRFVASIKAGSPNPALLQRGRDTFAGYNVMAIAVELPLRLIKGDSNVIGVAGATLRQTQSILPNGEIKRTGPFIQIDREGNPGINAVLTPVPIKNKYNVSTPVDDAKGLFAPEIAATLKSLGTDPAHIKILADIAITHGDYLHLDTSVANTGPQAGTNTGAGFPNGRRPADDVIDTILTVVANGTPLGDNVNSNDVAFQDTFPFLAKPHQPLPTGTIDDNTRN